MGSPEPLRYLRQDVQKLTEEVEKLAGDSEKDIRGIETIRAKVESLSRDANRLERYERRFEALYEMTNLVKEMVDLNHNVLVRVDKRVTRHAEVLNKLIEFCDLSIAESKIIAEYIGISDDDPRLGRIERRLEDLEQSNNQ